MRPLLLHESRIVQSMLLECETGSHWPMPEAAVGCFFPEEFDQTGSVEINGGYTLFFEGDAGNRASLQRVAFSSSIPRGGELFLVGNHATGHLSFLDHFAAPHSDTQFLRPYAQAVCTMFGQLPGAANSKGAGPLLEELAQAVMAAPSRAPNAKYARLLILGAYANFFVSEAIEVLTGLNRSLWRHEFPEAAVQTIATPDRQLAVDGWMRIGE